MYFTVSFTQTKSSNADTAIVCIFEENTLSASAKEFDKKFDGAMEDYLNNQNSFNGKEGQTLAMPVTSASGYNRIFLLGLGDPSKIDTLKCETIGGKLADKSKEFSIKDIHLYIDNDDIEKNIGCDEIAAHIINGFHLKSYQFKKYKTEKEEESETTEINSLTLISDAYKEAKKLYEDLYAVTQGTYLARDLVNEPPNELYPESFAQIIKNELKPLGVEIEVIDEKKMEKMGFHAHLAVGMGSARKPRVVVMKWNGDGDKKPLAFVGKGITFDTGGINLKPSGGLEEMKLDMGGAASVVGLLKAVALRKAKANVIGIVALAENMPSSNAYRPSDVIQSLSGKTIEVSNTDAEGRLVLADSITYLQKTYNPEFIIDLATLTGAMMVALGFDYCGTFVNNDDLWKKMQKAGTKTGEQLWRMPLDEAYRKEMDSTIADIKTLGTSGRYAGACTAAGFLERFIENDLPWSHMDIAGVAWIKKDRPTCPKPGTGFGVRVLNSLIQDNYEAQ
jgi:leucyl aminopeptidase